MCLLWFKPDQRIEALNKQLAAANQTLVGKEKELAEAAIVSSELKNVIDKLNVDMDKLEYELEQATLVPKIDPLEKYWNEKRAPTNNYRYAARATFGSTSANIPMDVRDFYMPGDFAVPTVNGATNDEKAMNALKYVINATTYEGDSAQFKRDEEWLFPFETLKLGHGDCEDGAILLANIMLKSGVPYWRIRLNAGSVNGGGHCWVTYLKESDNSFYIYDWCYWPDESKKGLTWKNAQNYFDIWFSWNQKYTFAQDMLDRPVAKGSFNAKGKVFGKGTLSKNGKLLAKWTAQELLEEIKKPKRNAIRTKKGKISRKTKGR